MANVVSQFIFHPAASQSLKYAGTTAYRAVQYFARFFAWYLLTTGDKDAAAKWNALKSHLGTARKLMRLGKPMEHLQAALRATLASGPVGEQLTTIARQVGYFGFLTYDAIVWAGTIKFIKLSPETLKKVQKTSFRFWFAGILFSIINGTLKTARLLKESKRLRTGGEKDLAEETARENRLNALEASRVAARQQLTIDLLDIWIPATGAELVSVSEGTLGIFGLITSLLGAKTQWKAVNSSK
ncbi:hypothetical protein AX17_000247 [Amanita inopinata Kibby_2008]|nr:hypothetical protein AX17_000247 [Amanita inopinata Kibby_2008]